MSNSSEIPNIDYIHKIVGGLAGLGESESNRELSSLMEEINELGVLSIKLDYQTVMEGAVHELRPIQHETILRTGINKVVSQGRILSPFCKEKSELPLANIFMDYSTEDTSVVYDVAPLTSDFIYSVFIKREALRKWPRAVILKYSEKKV